MNLDMAMKFDETELSPAFLNRQLTPRELAPFFSQLMRRTHTTVHHSRASSIEMYANRQLEEGNALDYVFHKFFSARVWQLIGEHRNAANCYDQAGKNILNIKFEKDILRDLRIQAYEQCGNCYLTIEEPDFLNSGYAFLKAADSNWKRRYVSFKLLKKAERSFFCADVETEDIKLYDYVIRHLSPIAMDDSILNQLENMKTRGDTNIFRTLMAELQFSEECEFSRNKLERLIENENELKSQIILYTICARREELNGKHNNAQRKYEIAGKKAESIRYPITSLDLRLKGVKNKKTLGRNIQAAKELLHICRLANPKNFHPAMRMGFFNIARTLAETSRFTIEELANEEKTLRENDFVMEQIYKA